MVSRIFVPLSFLEAASAGVPDLRAPLIFAEPLTGGQPDARAALIFAEPLTGGNPDLRAPLIFAEPLTGGNPDVRCALMVIEALMPVLEEGPMVTDLFPLQLGVSWTTHKIMNFATQVRTSTSLRTARNSLTQFPAWDFEVSFVYLPTDKPFASGTAQADLYLIQGFFFDMRGRQKAFLFRDPQDYRVRAGAAGVGDAVTTAFYFTRTLRTLAEPVGQVDMLQKFAFAPGDVNAGADTIAAPAHGLSTGDGPLFAANTGGALPAGLTALTPYWVIADSANAVRLAASEANALAGTAVDITGAGTGAHSLTGGWAVYVGGTLQLSGVSFFAPNQFVFGVAPAAGAVITADFDFFFVCHFLSDIADAEQFNSNLFQLMQVQFRADPP